MVKFVDKLIFGVWELISFFVIVGMGSKCIFRVVIRGVFCEGEKWIFILILSFVEVIFLNFFWKK